MSKAVDESPSSSPPEQDEAPKQVDIVGATDFLLTALFILALFYTLYLASRLLLPIVMSLLGAIVFAPLVRTLARWRIPAPLGALAVVLGLLATLGAAVYFLSTPAMEWLDNAPQRMREIEDKLREIKKPVEKIQKATEQVEELGRDKTKLPPVEVKPPPLSSQLLTGAQNFLIAAVSAIVLLYFLLASEDIFLRKTIHVLTRLRDKIKAVELVRDIENQVSRYLATITAINIGLGIVTAILMYFLDMPNPVLWGVVAAVLNYIPYLGPLVALTLFTFVAMVTFDDIARIAVVPAAFLALTTLEGQLLNPMIVGHRLTLNPVIVFLSLLLWGWLWGALGVLLAVPILVTLKVVCDHIEGFGNLGEFLGEKRPS
ncbi:MAG: AI-2E family transporter [Burkholderiales bacterium]